jgi:hypothetical protein
VLGHPTEATPNVGGVERGAESRRKDEIIVGPACRAAQATLRLPASLRSKRKYAIVRELEGASSSGPTPGTAGSPCPWPSTWLATRLRSPTARLCWKPSL